MSLPSKVLLFISCILTFTTTFFMFKFMEVGARNRDLQDQNERFHTVVEKRTRLAETQNARTLDAERTALQAKDEARDKILQANEMKAELERRIAEALVAQKESVALLNARLDRETTARQKAEKDAEKYFAQKESMEEDLLMYWSDMEVLKVAHNRKYESLKSKSDAKIKELSDELEKIKSELEKAKTSIRALYEEKQAAASQAQNLQPAAQPSK